MAIKIEYLKFLYFSKIRIGLDKVFKIIISSFSLFFKNSKMSANIDVYFESMMCLRYLVDKTVALVQKTSILLPILQPKVKPKIKPRKRLKAPKYLSKNLFLANLTPSLRIKLPKPRLFNIETFNFEYKLCFIFKVNFLDLIQIITSYFWYLNKKKTAKIKLKKLIFKLDYFYFKQSYLGLKSIQIDNQLLKEEINKTENLKSKKVKFKPKNKVYEIQSTQPFVDENLFKTPFSMPIIESTQAFCFVPPTQCFQVEYKENYFPCTQPWFSQIKQSVLEEEEEEPTQILEQEQEFQVDTKKKESQENKRKYMDFIPVCSNSVKSDLGTQVIQKSQSCLNSTESNGVLKPLKRRSFMTLGLSKKQRIKTHLHKI